MGRRKRLRRKEWINGHFVDRPQTEAWRKFLQATLPEVEPNIQGIDQDKLKDWLNSIDEKNNG
tara:strand:- start:348 stop:536 length:189 start_codon:yes stop_codon:yes gene_type:complete